MRKVKVYSTAFGLKVVNSAATTWAELKTDLTSNNISYSNMNAAENVRNTTLVLDEASLPEGEFVLILTPIKTKSGNDYKVIRAAIVEIINDFGEEAKAHFNEGKNYTNKSKDELAKLLQQWNARNGKVTSTPVVTKPVTVTSVKEEKVMTMPAVTKPEVGLPVKVGKPTFLEALRNLLEYSEVHVYEDLMTEINNAIENILENEDEDTPTEELSEEEKAWINKMKNM